MGGPNPRRIEIENEVEGEPIDTSDYFFVKIGEAVPLKSHDSGFDLQSLPSQPLAVSERFRLIFVAHSSGFFVSRTKDVMDSAKEFKEKGRGSPIQQLSLVDVPIGKVHILALSMDNTMLAASVSGDIQFYSVENFLRKQVRKSFSCSLNDSSCLKDMRWKTKSENSFVVLSNAGKLYYGEVDCPLKYLMDSVEAVEWGMEGKFVAVARKNVLSILSSRLEEQASISLSFRSWIGDSNGNGSVKVDSIKWVRPDSIVLGCFQLSEDGKEESYLLQVIRSRDGEITDACSHLVAESFAYIYQGLIDDIVPYGSGPHLLLSYLKQCQVAINANKKNTEQHIMLLGWSVEDHEGEIVVVNIERDNWVPRIELQENGDDNLVLGLCVDNVSIYQKIGIQLGVEEMTELSPYCVLICLTLEGKLVMFHVASLAGSDTSAEVISALPDDKKAASVKLPVVDSSNFLNRFPKQELNDVSLGVQFQDMTKNGKFPIGDDKTCTKNALQASELCRNLDSLSSADSYQMPHGKISTQNQKVDAGANLIALEHGEQQMAPDVYLKEEVDGWNPRPSGEQSMKSGHFPSNASPLELAHKDFSKIDSQNHAMLGSCPGSVTVKDHMATHDLASFSNLKNSTEKSEEVKNKNVSGDSQSASSLLLSCEKFSSSNVSSVLSFSASSYPHDNSYQNETHSFGSRNVHSTMIGVLPDVTLAGGAERTSRGARNMEPVSIRSSQLSSQENTVIGRSSLQEFCISNEQHRNSSMLGISCSEPNLSKQFANINEMTRELDLLLSSIEEAGGFRDACTRSLNCSIEALEQEMDSLSQKCKLWTNQVDKHLAEVHYLFDKTIQVMARKMYIEGILKQASDSQYWELWSRQKLNSELELKHQHILTLSQDLTNQLIELERHFNALDLNKFSEFGGHHVAFQSRYGPSRHIQSLRSVYNAMSSQLVAAENLSEFLSKQMEALTVKAPSDNQKNVKKLFESIGIPYEASFGSSDMKGLMETPSTRRPLLFDSSAKKDCFKRNKGNTMKSCEPEMARRNGDSLDKSWTCFNPPKTIVKRALLQEVQKPNLNRSYFSMDKRNVMSPSTVDEFALHPRDFQICSTLFPESERKEAIQDAYSKKTSEPSKEFIWANNLPAPTEIPEFKSPMFPRNNFSACLSLPISQLSDSMKCTHSKDTQDLIGEKFYRTPQKFDLNSNGESKPVLQTDMGQKLCLSLCPASEMSTSNSKMTMLTSLALETRSTSTKSSENWRNHDFRLSDSPTVSAASMLVGKVPVCNADESHPDGIVSAVPALSISTMSLSFPPIQTAVSPFSSSPLATVPSAGLSVPSSGSLTSSITSISAKVISKSSSSASSVDSYSDSSSDLAPLQLMHSSFKSSLNSTSEAVKSKAPLVTTPKIDSDAAKELQVEPQNIDSKLKLELSGCGHSSAISGGQSSNNITSPAPSPISVSQPEQPTDALMQFSTSFSASVGITNGKSVSLDAGITDEDEMEEEAPEMSDTAELNLESLGAFGIGSTPNQPLPKLNPFGGSFSNASTSQGSSTVTFSVPSGDLFRPASFSLPTVQSPSPSNSTNSAVFSGGFSAATTVNSPTHSAFGQAVQIGLGQQALGSVLGTFGQSRQLGSAPPASGFAAPTGFGGGGFAGLASKGGGFAGIGSTVGGFAAGASTGDGFAGVASAGGGFAAVSSAGGFAWAASGGGFGAFNNRQGTGGFAGFGTTGGTSKPPELFTQMRK